MPQVDGLVFPIHLGIHLNVNLPLYSITFSSRQKVSAPGRTLHFLKPSCSKSGFLLGPSESGRIMIFLSEIPDLCFLPILKITYSFLNSFSQLVPLRIHPETFLNSFSFVPEMQHPTWHYEAQPPIFEFPLTSPCRSLSYWSFH